MAVQKKPTGKKPAAKKPAAKAGVTSKKPAAKAGVKGKKPATKAGVKGKSTGAAKKPAAKKPATKKRGPAVDKRTITRLEKHLEEERAVLLAQFEELEEERRMLAEDREDTDDSFSEESGEGATVTMEQEKDLSLSANAHELLEKVDKALGKIKSGNYGYCERCGEKIAKPRLEALPYAELCITCKQKEERRF